MRGNLIAAIGGFLLALAIVEIFSGFRKGSVTTIHSSAVFLTDEQQQAEAGRNALQMLMTQRICGSPAIDGYIHVDVGCFRSSPVAQWYLHTHPLPSDLVVHIERRADYDGLAVAWGLGHKASSVEACAAMCRDHIPPDPLDTVGFGALPCNAFVFCAPSGEQETCFEPDIHKHTKNDCWLKFTESPASPEVNMRGKITRAQQQRHVNVPKDRVVPWHSGVLLPRGVELTNGTWSPRSEW